MKQWKSKEEKWHYCNVHSWLRRNFGKPTKCEGKNCSGISKYISYALISGKEYEKVRDNFICLCTSCHRIYDMTEEKRKHMSESHKGQQHPSSSYDTLRRKLTGVPLTKEHLAKQLLGRKLKKERLLKESYDKGLNFAFDKCLEKQVSVTYTKDNGIGWAVPVSEIYKLRQSIEKQKELVGGGEE